jgi:sulfoxide reductase heme-binding subunit YedZ
MKSRWLKPAVFIGCLIPLGLLIWKTIMQQLGANPVETLTHDTGDWALRFLLITLAVTPARKLLDWKWAPALRRMLGLYAFFYACLHFSVWLVFDHFFDLGEIVADIVKRPYITVGFIGFVLLIPLAVTSTNTMIRRLGKRWKQLHQLIYLIGVCGVLHFLWLVKADILEPAIYGAILVLLLGLRAWLQRRPQTLRPFAAARQGRA